MLATVTGCVPAQGCAPTHYNTLVKSSMGSLSSPGLEVPFGEARCSSRGSAVAQGGVQAGSGVPEALCVAAQEVAAETMAACKDPLVKKQLAYLLGRQGVVCPPSAHREAVAVVHDEEARANSLFCRWDASCNLAAQHALWGMKLMRGFHP